MVSASAEKLTEETAFGELTFVPAEQSAGFFCPD